MDWLHGFTCVVDRNNSHKLKKLERKIKRAVVRYGGVLCEFIMTDDYDDDGLETFHGEGDKELIDEQKRIIKHREKILMQGNIGT